MRISVFGGQSVVGTVGVAVLLVVENMVTSKSLVPVMIPVMVAVVGHVLLDIQKPILTIYVVLKQYGLDAHIKMIVVMDAVEDRIVTV